MLILAYLQTKAQENIFVFHGKEFIQIPLLMFCPGSSPSDFHKNSEDPNCLTKQDQHKNNNNFGIHARNSPNVDRNLASKGTLIFLSQNLGFVLTKSLLTSTKETEFLGLVINSVNITLTLPQEKILDSQNKCMQLIASSKTTIMEVTKLLGKLSFTAQTVLPRRIQCRYLQQQQIQAVRELNSYQTKIKLSQQSLAELRWWKENLLFQNGKPLSMRNAIVKPQYKPQEYYS